MTSKTDAMFRRYAIVDDRDLREAVARLAEANAPKVRAIGG
jgi:hypothetical protein